MSDSTPAELWARLESFQAEAPKQPGRQRNSYRHRAAVLAWFDEDQLIGPIQPGPPDREFTAFLAEDCSRITLPDGARHWAIKDPLRRIALAELKEAGKLRSTLESVPGRPDNPVQRALDDAITGGPPAPGDEPPETLRARLQVADWLAGERGEPAAVPGEIRARLDLSDLLDPLRELLRHGFEGRQKELDRLRQYVGVLPPGSLHRRLLARVRSLREQPPLLIWGAGGVGKSTLVAKFVLEHYGSPDPGDRFPFAYLNFDRSALDPLRPSSLVVEAVRQLGLQYPRLAPEAAESVELIGESSRYYESRSQVAGSQRLGQARTEDQRSAVAELGRLVRGAAGTARPLLLVLDTFEEVRRQGTAALASVLELLESLQQQFPMLRIVLASRAQVSQYKTSELPLRDLDDRSARAYLEARVPGLSSRDLRRAVRKVKGNPLKLRLAARILSDPAEDRSLAFLRLDQAEAEAVLYDRILGHIGDPEIRCLAHPGLVLRRITPEIIAKVLAKNCGLGQIDARRAADLFGRLEAEATLVERRGEDPGALYHRLDVRQMMLPYLRDSMRDTVAAIDRDAVAYYSRLHGPLERAEELYHRMMRGDTSERLSARWQDEAGRFLRISFDELPKPAQVFLAPKLGFEIGADVRREAGADSWARYAQQEVQRLTRVGRLDEALSILRERRGPHGESLLPELELEVLEQQGHLDFALELGRRWLDATVRAGGVEEFVGASLDVARVAERANNLAEATNVLRQAHNVVHSSRRNLDILRVDVGLLRLGRTTGATVPEDALEGTAALARAVGLYELGREPALLRELAAEIGPVYPELLTVTVREIGVDLDLSSWRATRLAGALVEWDQKLSIEGGNTPGALRAMARLPSGGSPLQAWQKWLKDQQAGLLSRQLARLLEEFYPPAREVLTCLTELYREEIDQGLLSGTSKRQSSLAPAEEAVRASRQAAKKDPEAHLPELAAALANHSVVLAELGRPEEALASATEAVEISRRIEKSDPGTHQAELASALRLHGAVLAGLGRQESALEPTQEAVQIYRDLATGAYLPDLASALNNLGALLAEQGRPERALAALQEAVGIRRQLAAAGPDAYLADLASALNNLGALLADLGHPERAMDAVQEAVGIRRRLAAADPDTYLADLASALNNLAVRLGDVGRRDAGLAAIEEAAAMYRRLAHTGTGAYQPDLARALNNLSVRYGEAGRHAEGLAAVEESTAIYRALAKRSPGTYRAALATSLHNLSLALAGVGRRSEGLAAAGEAADILGRMAEANPDAYRPPLARSLSNLASRLAEAGRAAEALPVAEQAVAILEQLAAANPDAYLPDLARSLNSLVVSLAEMGRRPQALAAAQRAVDIRRQLVAANRDAYLPDLARSLRNLSVRLAEAGRSAEALAVAREATAIWEHLAEASQEAYLPDLAMTLNNLSNRIADTGDLTQALAVAERAMAMRERLAAASGEAYLPALAMSLGNVSNLMARTGQRAEALAVAERAADIGQRLADASPDIYEPDLAVALGTLSRRRAEAGQAAEAVAAAERAAGIWERLAAERPDEYQRALGLSLRDLSARLAESGRQADSLAAGRRGVAVWERLAAERPDEYRPVFAMSLNNLAVMLAGAGRHDEGRAAAESAVAIYRQLAGDRPDAFEPHLAKSLWTLAVVHEQDGGDPDAGIDAARESVMLYRRWQQRAPHAFDAELQGSTATLAGALDRAGRGGEAAELR